MDYRASATAQAAAAKPARQPRAPSVRSSTGGKPVTFSSSVAFASSLVWSDSGNGSGRSTNVMSPVSDVT